MFQFRVASRSAARPRGKTPLQGNRLGELGVGPGHPRLGHPLARRFSSTCDRGARTRCSRVDATRKVRLLTRCGQSSEALGTDVANPCGGDRSRSPDRVRRLRGSARLSALQFGAGCMNRTGATRASRGRRRHLHPSAQTPRAGDPASQRGPGTGTGFEASAQVRRSSRELRLD